MITLRDHPALIQPSDDDILWRYLSLDKFESSLMKSALFFCRADRFSDPFEGSLPLREAEYRIKDLENISRFYNSTTFNRVDAQKSIDAISETHKKFKRAVVVNCWHINNNESVGMWQLYLKSNVGIAIKSNAQRLIKSFEESPEEVNISKVRYINYENDIWFNEKVYPCSSYNFLTPIVHKRIEFSHENELRLLYHIREAEDDEKYWLNQEYEKGMFIKVNMDVLIDEIVLPPTSDSYIENRVIELMKWNGLLKEIKKSKLSSEPIY